VTAWLIVSGIAVLLGVAVWGGAKALERASSRYPHPEPGPVRPWQPDTSRFGICLGCHNWRPRGADGLIADHNYPEASVPYDQQSFRCDGTGQKPAQAKASER
jgi:hypothetical protein